jgi:hypothetical protein
MNGDVERFVYKRGQGAKRRVMHLAGYNRLGAFAGVLCGSQVAFNTSCNLPLGQRVCKRCKATERKLTA